MRLLLLLVILFTSLPLYAFDHTYLKYGEFLGLVVEYKEEGKKSLVRYKTASRKRQNLEAFLKETEVVTKDEYNSWTENQKLAFLINTYNGRVVQLIAKNQYNIESIKDVGPWYANVFERNFFRLFGRKRHLDYIEHEMIRKDFEEPRIHFALNCGALSCPILQKLPYLPETLQEQLDSSTKNFLQDSNLNYFSIRNRYLHLSLIFKWYKVDFVEKYGSVAEFVVPYMTPHLDEQDVLLGDNVNMAYFDYDWDLNRYFEK